MRLLILLIILYFGYKKLKTWVARNIIVDRGEPSKPAIDDDLIQDPHCRIYFPRRIGYHLHIDGEDLYFCSAECREAYKADHSR